jgi:Inorganic pyrophosphatase
MASEQAVCRVLVEIPKGSRNKYEWDDESGTVALDRRLFAAVSYPTDYRFIPEMMAEDGDELDVKVAVTEPTFPGCSIASNGLPCSRCTPLTDPAWQDLDELEELPGDLAGGPLLPGLHRPRGQGLDDRGLGLKRGRPQMHRGGTRAVSTLTRRRLT